MLIRRCAWHRLYWRRPRWSGIAAWRPFFRLAFTDGMCPRCRDRFRVLNAAALRAPHAGGAA